MFGQVPQPFLKTGGEIPPYGCVLISNMVFADGGTLDANPGSRKSRAYRGTGVGNSFGLNHAKPGIGFVAGGRIPDSASGGEFFPLSPYGNIAAVEDDEDLEGGDIVVAWGGSSNNRLEYYEGGVLAENSDSGSDEVNMVSGIHRFFELQTKVREGLWLVYALPETPVFLAQASYTTFQLENGLATSPFRENTTKGKPLLAFKNYFGRIGEDSRILVTMQRDELVVCSASC